MTGIVFTYSFDRKYFNIGDYIQSLATIDNYNYLGVKKLKFVNREKMNSYKFLKDEFCIQNGWFQHNPESFRFLDNGIYVSFHLTNSLKNYIVRNKSLLKKIKSKNFLSRDLKTSVFLNELGINCNVGYCLTLTLKKRKILSKKYEYLFVDCLYRRNFEPRSIYLFFKSFLTNITKHLILIKLYGFKYINAPKIKSTNLNSKYNSEQSRFDLAEEHLRMFMSSENIVTSRIHCALPSLGFGKKITYIHDKFGLSDESRLDGILDFFDVITLGNKYNPLIINHSFKRKKIKDISNTINKLRIFIRREFEKIYSDKS